MKNYNEMTSKQLKELGKENHVKNWWNLSKAALIAALLRSMPMQMLVSLNLKLRKSKSSRSPTSKFMI